MEAHEILTQNTAMLESLARAGIAVEDVKYLPLWREYVRLRDNGLKTMYIVAHLCDEYAVSERTVYRTIRRFGRKVPVKM